MQRNHLTDNHSDGKLNEAERQAAKADFEKRLAERNPGILARFDKDGDGQLSEEEKRAAREAFRRDLGGAADKPTPAELQNKPLQE